MDRRGMTVVFIAHSATRIFKNPEGDDFDRIEMDAHHAFSRAIKKCVDVYGYCAFEQGASKTNTGATKGWSTGRRLVHLVRRAAFDAKSRVVMPAEVELSIEAPWAPFLAASMEDDGKTSDDIIAEIALEVDRIGDPDVARKVHEAATSAAKDKKNGKDILIKYLMDLKSRPAVESTEKEEGEQK